MNSGKNYKIVGLRPSKIGDVITSLPILYVLEKMFPNSYKTISIAKKNWVCASLLFNNKLIDRIHINEILEQPNKEDYDFFNSHDFIIKPDLQHPEFDWYNKYHMVFENARMMGLEKEWNELLTEKEKIPHLDAWFDIVKNGKTIAIWPMAGNGLDFNRSPNEEWYNKLIEKVLQQTSYDIIQFGHKNDFEIDCNDFRFQNLNHLDFFEQIKMTLGCSLMIGTDAGSSLIIAAYNLIPQICLLTNWQNNHHSNFLALSPLSDKCINIFKKDNINLILQEKIIESIKILS